MIRVHNGQIVADDFVPPTAVVRPRPGPADAGRLPRLLLDMRGRQLEKRRALTCSLCDRGRLADIAGVEVCAVQFPDADCYCEAKIVRAWPGHLAWLARPESCCPHPEGPVWGPEADATAPVEERSMDR